MAWKSGLKVPFLLLGCSCSMQTFLLSDLVGCDSPPQIIMPFWRTIIVSRGLSNPSQKVWIKTKRAPNCNYYLQRAAVTPDWFGTIALWWHIRAFFSMVVIGWNPLMIWIAVYFWWINKPKGVCIKPAQRTVWNLTVICSIDPIYTCLCLFIYVIFYLFWQPENIFVIERLNIIR